MELQRSVMHITMHSILPSALSHQDYQPRAVLHYLWVSSCLSHYGQLPIHGNDWWACAGHMDDAFEVMVIITFEVTITVTSIASFM